MGKLAINAKLYRNTGTYEAPTLTPVDLVRDGTLTVAWDEANADARESRVHQNLKSMLSLEFSFMLKKKPGDAGYEALMNLLLNDDTEDFFILDGPEDEEGVRGFRWDGAIFSATEDQSLGNVLYEDMVTKPIVIDNPVLAVRVASGPTLTYSPVGADGGVFA